jgi:Putative sensor
MVLMTDAPGASTAIAIGPGPKKVPLRLFLLGRSAIVMVTSLIGAVLFSMWLTLVAVSPITILAPLVLPMTALVRWYANIHRHDAEQLLGTRVDSFYREPARKGVIGRVLGIVRDPASWRDAWWLLLHSIVGCVTAALSFFLFAGGLFYLIYPLLFAVTPERVFGHPFGNLVQFHSVAQSCVMMPLALVSFGLWYGLAIPLVRAELTVTKKFLRR